MSRERLLPYLGGELLGHEHGFPSTPVDNAGKANLTSHLVITTHLVTGAALSGLVLVLSSCASRSAEPVQPAGPSLSVDPTQELVGPTTVSVTGQGFDPRTGIYVAYCVEPDPGQPPTPCGGGADMSGTSGSSHWISSDPPDYGRDLAAPFGPDGSFTVRLRVSPRIGAVDCRATPCVIATRADHTRSSDRSADVFVPVTFKEKK